MATGTLDTVILAIIIGTLAAIVYSLRILVLMERRMARIDVHVEALVTKVFQEEQRIESKETMIEGEEDKIEAMFTGARTRRPASAKVSKPKASKKKVAKKTVKKKAKKATKKAKKRK